MENEREKLNHLAGESSPYLLQHVKNPVDWYPWGDVAFNKAREEDKPIFLSIGYSAWKLWGLNTQTNPLQLSWLQADMLYVMAF